MLGIRPCLQHFLIMIRLYNEIIRITYHLLYVIRHMSGISDDTEDETFILYLISHIIIAVMRHLKRSDMEIPHIKRYVFFHIFPHRERHRMTNAVILVYPCMNLLSGIPPYLHFLAYRPHALHMVGMVMRNKNIMYSFKLQPIFMKVFFQRPQTYAQVYNQAILVIKKIVAISTATTPE